MQGDPRTRNVQARRAKHQASEVPEGAGRASEVLRLTGPSGQQAGRDEGRGLVGLWTARLGPGCYEVLFQEFEA